MVFIAFLELGLNAAHAVDSIAATVRSAPSRITPHLAQHLAVAILPRR
jgi:hypothetical protein